MGVVRYPVECPGCAGKILLRLGVGHDQRQPFFYVCGTCRAATKGALIWDGGIGTELELEDGRRLDSEEGCIQTIHVNPEYPTVPDAKELNSVGGSAFLFHRQVLGGERVAFFQQQVAKFESFVTQGWPALRRLTAYYLNRDWRHFDEGLKPLVAGAIPPIHDDWVRDDLLHKLHDHAFIPLTALGPHSYPEMKLEWNALWNSQNPAFPAMIAYATREVATDAFRQLQRDLFHLLEQYVELRRTIAAGLLLDQYPVELEDERNKLRLFRDDFVVLRDFYIQAFEQCHRGLRYAIGALNVRQRGSEHSFTAWPSKPFGRVPNQLTSLDEFTALVSANKRLWVMLLPGWNTWWDDFFDRSLRNDIGHASVRHRLADGVLERNDKPPLPYLDFVRIAARIGNPILMMLNVLKMLLVYGGGPIDSKFAEPGQHADDVAPH